MNRLSQQGRAGIVGCLVEGNSLRATTRMTGCSINTVTKLPVDMGTATCRIYQNETPRSLHCTRLQLDGIWSFCYTQQMNVAPWHEGVLGFCVAWTWTAIRAKTKLVSSWLVGPHYAFYARTFVDDLAAHLAELQQITMDGLQFYVKPIEDACGSQVDYTIRVKRYGDAGGNQQERCYCTGQCCGTITGAICGDPDEKHVSTSLVGRQNLTMRLSVARFTRCTNGVSKKIENDKQTVALHYMYYNFRRINKKLRVTPAMEAKASDHVWGLEEIAKLAD